MNSKIKSLLDDPNALESLYQQDKVAFRRNFKEIFPEISQHELAQFWNARLNFKKDQEGISWGSSKDLLLVLCLAIGAGIVVKIPDIASIDEDFFFPRNISFIVFPFVIFYFAVKNRLGMVHSSLLLGFSLVAVFYINLLPDLPSSDTLILACIHLPLLFWGLLGSAFSGQDLRNLDLRMAFLRFNADTVIMGVVLGISFGLLSGLTIGLFNLIGLNIEEFYSQNILVVGLASIPILASHLTVFNPQLVNKVSPIIAKIFTPLVLVMLLTYLFAIIYSGKDPYNDREFLMLFNFLLIGVMALIFFSIAESSDQKSKLNYWLLVSLSTVTICVNCIALSAILFRISEWGITPNRLAVLGVNLLMLVHLLLVFRSLLKVFKQQKEMAIVGQTIASYLPIYMIWTLIVVFVFPLLFGFN